MLKSIGQTFHSRAVFVLLFALCGLSGCVLKFSSDDSEKSEGKSVEAEKNSELIFAKVILTQNELSQIQAHHHEGDRAILMNDAPSSSICFYAAKNFRTQDRAKLAASALTGQEMLAVDEGEKIEALRENAVSPVEAATLLNATIELLKLDPAVASALFSTDKSVSGPLKLNDTDFGNLRKKISTLKLGSDQKRSSQISCEWQTVAKSVLKASLNHKNEISEAQLSLASARENIYAALVIALAFPLSAEFHFPAVAGQFGGAAQVAEESRTLIPTRYMEATFKVPPASAPPRP